MNFNNNINLFVPISCFLKSQFHSTAFKSQIISYSNSREKDYFISKPCIPNNLSPWFLVGFFKAEFNFSISITKKSTASHSVKLRCRIQLHKRDALLLFIIQKYFNCGFIGKIDSRDCIEWCVSDIHSICSIIIPFFKQYPLRGTKYLEGGRCILTHCENSHHR